jgi:hypothetical protein
MNTLNPTGKIEYVLEIFGHNYDYQEQYSLKSKELIFSSKWFIY